MLMWYAPKRSSMREEVPQPPPTAVLCPRWSTLLPAPLERSVQPSHQRRRRDN